MGQGLNPLVSWVRVVLGLIGLYSNRNCLWFRLNISDLQLNSRRYDPEHNHVILLSPAGHHSVAYSWPPQITVLTYCEVLFRFHLRFSLAQSTGFNPIDELVTTVKYALSCMIVKFYHFMSTFSSRLISQEPQFASYFEMHAFPRMLEQATSCKYVCVYAL